MGPTTKAHKGQYLTPLQGHLPPRPPGGASRYKWGQVLLPSRSSWRGWVGTALVFPKQPHPCLFLNTPPQDAQGWKEGENTPVTSREHSLVGAGLLHSAFLTRPGNGPGL